MKRREFLRGLGGVAAAVAGGLAWGAPAAPKKRLPNVLLILADDLGAVDLACYGAADLRTPHLDALAGRGTRLTQFYVAAPICSPSRAALLTGRYPQRAGLTTNASLQGGLPAEQVTLAELLRGAGYRTALFGKWHLGGAPGLRPRDQGFDEFYGHHVGCIDNYSHFYYWGGPNRHDLFRGEEEHWEEGGYFPDLVTREALRFVSENRDRPFFLYLPYNIPHYPLQGEAKYRKMYESLPYPRRHYAPLVSTLDDRVGQVLARLDELGLRDDTLVVFLSDNGHSTEERAMFGGGSAGPYRGAKFSLLEGGIRMPCIVSLPGRVPAGQVRGQLATAMDLVPTVAELCGVAPPDRKIDGRSLLALLASADAPSPHAAVHWQTGNQWAVREGDWKLVINGRDLEGDDAKVFLANLAEDVGETKNLASARPEVVARLRNLHEAWAAEVPTQ